MIKNYHYNIKNIVILLCFVLFSVTTATAQYCGVGSTTTCGGKDDYTNFGMNSSNSASTISYDNWVAGFHASAIKNNDGTFSIWGEYMSASGTLASPLLIPQVVNDVTYPGLTGTVLKIAIGGSQQAIILTTDGLFSVGRNSSGYCMIPAPAVPNAFTKWNVSSTSNITNGVIGTGLPPGVVPNDVKMLFGTTNTLALTTCDGAVWVISQVTQTRGSGTGTNGTTWYRVRKSATTTDYLTDIVATRGNGASLFALDKNGNIWTWGQRVFLGDNASYGALGYTFLSYATKMTLPALNGASIKMIGSTMSNTAGSSTSSSATASTYYVLASDGKLFSLGNNYHRQLGNWTTTESRTWIQPTYTDGGLPMNNIKWISPQEHYSDVNSGFSEGSASINVLTDTGILYNWGHNHRGMLGRVNKPLVAPEVVANLYDPGVPTNGGTSPEYPINTTTKWNAIETGGHTTMAVKSCETELIYAGHRINGSMGDNSDVSTDQFFFTNIGTPRISICGASAVNHQLANGVTRICEGTSFAVTTSPSGGTYTVTSGNATGTNPFTITGSGAVVIQHTPSGGCAEVNTFSFPQNDLGNLDDGLYPSASATILASNNAWLGQNGAGFPTSDCALDASDANDGFEITDAICGSGTTSSPWTLHANQTYSYTVTVNGNGTNKPVYWAFWFDVNGDGDFTDTDDIFQSGNTIHNGPVGSTLTISVPSSVASLPVGRIGAIRVVATAVSTTFSQSQNGSVALQNGEIEDYLVNYASTTTCDIVANDDSGLPVNGATGGSTGINIFTNDVLGTTIGINSANINLTIIGTIPAGIVLNTTTGAVSVNPGTPSGTYTFTYQICEVAKPANCDDAIVTVVVDTCYATDGQVLLNNKILKNNNSTN